ncbi:hypothetical protein [Cytobacillus sp. FSL R5-0596]|uniref:hypothetical protein n=1 Tax=Cytobacillus sp. FSL R5-0596 TaxID=2954696 RepID=UPI0030F8F7BE
MIFSILSTESIGASILSLQSTDNIDRGKTALYLKSAFKINNRKFIKVGKKLIDF